MDAWDAEMWKELARSANIDQGVDPHAPQLMTPIPPRTVAGYVNISTQLLYGPTPTPRKLSLAERARLKVKCRIYRARTALAAWIAPWAIYDEDD